jgi:type I restriction enzyme S subunit
MLRTLGLERYDVGASNPTVNRNHLHELDVRVPVPLVQERIASILSAYDELIENNTRRIAILEGMARRIFEEWFVRFRAPGCDGLPMVESAIGTVPQGWEIATLESLCSRITDGAHHSPPSVEHGPPMLSVKDMRNWGFDFSECRSISQADFDDLVRNDCRPISGDILIAKDGANLNKHTFLIEEELDAVILSSIAILRPRTSVEKEFLVATLKSDDVSRRIKNSRSGAAIPRIILKDFRRLPVILPPGQLRARFEKAVTPIHRLCRLLSRSNANLRTQRDILLPKLISGEIDVSRSAALPEAAE